MKRKMAVSIMTCIMILSMILAGCGGQENQSTAASSSTGATAQNTTAEVKKEPVTLKFLAEESYLAQFSYADAPIFKELEKRANVKLELELVPPNDLMKVAQTRLAAGSELPDIMEYCVNSAQELFTAAQSGLILPLNDLIDKYAPNIKNVLDVEYPILKSSHTMPDGMIYSLTYIVDNEANLYCQDLIRVDWLKKVGIDKMPETVDDYYIALKTMREKDANGNGKQDEMWSGQPWQMSLTFPQAFGLHVQHFSTNWDVGEDGKVFSSYTSDKAKALYQFLNKLYTEKLIDPEYSTIAYDKFQTRLATNIVSASSFFAYAAQRYDDTVKGVEGVDYQVLAPLKGPDGNQLAIQFDIPGSGIGYNWVITKECKDTEAAIRFYDYIYSPEGRTLIQYGIEGTHYKMVDGKPETLIDQFVKDNAAKYKDKSEAFVGEGLAPACLPRIAVTKLDDFYKIQTDNTKRSMDVYKSGLQLLKMPYMSAVSTVDESKEEEAVGGDVWTYIAEMRDKFIMGKEPFDNWDKYVEKANQLGISKLQPLEQARYERYKNIK